MARSPARGAAAAGELRPERERLLGVVKPPQEVIFKGCAGAARGE